MHAGAQSASSPASQNGTEQPSPPATPHVLITTLSHSRLTCETQPDLEPNLLSSFHSTEPPDRRISTAVNLSLAGNILLLFAKLFAFYISGSLAVLASLADSFVDIFSQTVIKVADHQARTIDPRFPVGKTRLETVGVISCAVVMSLSAAAVIQSCAGQLWEGWAKGVIPRLDMSAVAYAILGGTIALKGFLYLLCVALSSISDTAMALAVDHMNDILSNIIALATAAVASLRPALWWADPVGALLISAYIITSWTVIAKQQIDKIVGRGAPEEFVAMLEAMAGDHHPMLTVDVIKAYHFGQRYIVEIEVVLPRDMTVHESHDIALALQQQVESLERVERCFVHVDYARRPHPEHKTERSLLASLDSIQINPPSFA